MKKHLIIVLSVLIMFSISCKAEEESLNNKSTEQIESNQKVEVDEKMLDVELDLPRTFFGDSSFEEIEENAKEYNVKKVVENDDGSIKYIMTKKDHSEMLKTLKVSLFNDDVEELLNNFESIKEISSNKDCTEFTVTVDKQLYKQGMDSMFLMYFDLSAPFYQALSGVSEEDISYTINLKDSTTGEIFETTNKP